MFMNENQEEPLFYDTLIVKTKRSSKKERRADALALRADERRDSHIEGTRGTETSKYPEEEKTTVIS